MRLKTGFLAVTILVASPLAYAGEAGMSFSHKDWEIACDNTRTCRAAGYQSDDEDEIPVSVLLTRLAGPGEKVKGELMIGDYDEEQLKKLPDPIRLTMKINGKGYGIVAVKQKDMVGDLSDEQVTGLIDSLPRSSVIEWGIGENRWLLSDKGASAVLLKMDEYQGRLGTTGALIKKGKLGEEKVLPPLPAPVVVAVKVAGPESGERQISDKEQKILRDALKKTVEEDDCYLLFESEAGGAQISITRLGNKKLLASTLCWSAAYNAGSGYWVINEVNPYNPVLVTPQGTDYSDGVISSSQKGRGIGDCWSSDVWTWNGKEFVHTESSTTGMCKEVKAGGAWELPTIVTDVRR